MPELIEQEVHRQAAIRVRAIIETEMEELRVEEIRKKRVVRNAVLREDQKHRCFLIPKLLERKRIRCGERSDLIIGQHRQCGLRL